MIVALGMSIPFSIYTKKKLLSYVQTRAGETKFGESVACLEDGASIEALADNASKYVLIGIPEDFGVRANFGRPGAHTAFEWALKALLNTQSNSFFNLFILFFLWNFPPVSDLYSTLFDGELQNDDDFELQVIWPDSTTRFSIEYFIRRTKCRLKKVYACYQ